MNAKRIEEIRRKIDLNEKMGYSMTNVNNDDLKELLSTRLTPEQVDGMVRIERAPKAWSGIMFDVPEWVQDVITHEGCFYFASMRLSRLNNANG